MSKNNWPPYNVKAITDSFIRVIDEQNIDYLTKDAYTFATLYLGFIAHYNWQSFKETYRNDLVTFVDTISNASVNRYRTDKWFENEYGADYVNSIYNIGIRVIQHARDSKEATHHTQYERNKENARNVIAALKGKYKL